MNQPDDQWAKDALLKLANASLVEQRIKRRWGLVFKLLVLAYLTVILIAVLPLKSLFTLEKEHTAVVYIDGPIAKDESANSQDVIKSLRRAFEEKNAKGVIVAINSPGGSPVQSAEIFDEMRALKAQYPDKPLYAVISDMGASGGYYIAVGAEKIFANSASIVGSIGVVAGGFGFVELLKSLGIERRAYVSGDNKALLDPFAPENPEQRAFFQSQLVQIHEQFIDAVKLGRGTRLKDDPLIFSGYFWTGKGAKELGLIDDFGSLNTVAEKEIGAKEIVDYSAPAPIFDRLTRRVATKFHQLATRWQWQ